MKTDTPITDELDDKVSPDTLGTDWKKAYFAMLIHAKDMERKVRQGNLMPDALHSHCWWSPDGGEEGPFENAMFATQCGHYFKIDSGTPTENGMAYCVFCGRPIDEDREDDLT